MLFLRACLKIVNTPKQQAFFRHTSPIFLERHPVFLRKIGLVWQQNPPHLVIFPFFKQGLIKNFNYSISARDTGNDLVRQRANSIAQSLDNFFQRSKYFVMESTLSNFFPNLFNRVHFRRIWWNIEKDNIIRQI